MNLEVKHRNAEQEAKSWLVDQFTTHRTSLDKFSTYVGSEYEAELARLAKNTLGYILQSKDEKQAKYYCSTTGIDYEL